MRSIPLLAAVPAFALALAAPAPLAAQLTIAIVGDSMASGEGNPDVDADACAPGPGPAGGTRVCRRFPAWLGRTGRAATPTDAVCHRGTVAGPLAAAERLRADLAGIEPVTVETFACSGATTVSVGAASTTAFSSVEPVGTITVPAQLTTLAGDPQFANPATGNRIDAVIMFVGANDIGFSGIATGCALDPRGECYRIAPIAAPIAGLAASYATLQTRIAATLRGRVGNVFIVEYHNPSTGPRGPCGATTALEGLRPRVAAPDFTDLPFFWGISWYESRFVSDTLVPALNGAVAAGAAAQGWQFVGGVAEAFRGRGHCASRDSRLVRNLNDSLGVEGGPWGVVHPNRAGHAVLRDIIRGALQPYMDRLAAPDRTRFLAAPLTPTQLSWSGGTGPRHQAALIELADATPRGAIPAPPGFPGDGARQRVSVDSAGLLSLAPFAPPGTTPARSWQLSEHQGAQSRQADDDRHFAAAVRSCNALRCSGWGPVAVTPAAMPRFARFVRSAGGPVAAWAAHRRNGVYQVAVPTGTRRWDVLVVAGTASGEIVAAQPQSRSSWSEAGPAPSLPPGTARRDDGGARVQIASTFARTAEFHVRGCNQTGCSAWASAADYVNALRTPAPGRFEVVMSALPCEMRGGRPVCGSADQGRRRSVWPEVPGANVYQIAAIRIGGGVEPLASVEPGAVIDRNRHRGLRVRACNVASCSAWSEARMLDGAGTAPPPPAGLALPANEARIQATGAPPGALPPP